MYSLFLWSWILLAFYILVSSKYSRLGILYFLTLPYTDSSVQLNIFLAILVEGYIAVKKESEEKGASGIIF